MPTFTHGKDAKVFANGYDMSGYLSSVTVSGEADTAETSTLGGTAKTYIAGMRDATVSAEGFFSIDAGGSDERLAAQLGTSVVFTVVLSADAVGANGYGMTAIETSYEAGAEIGGAVSISVEGQSTVGQEPIRVLNPLSAKTATSSNASVDNAASTTNGYSAYLHVTAASGTTPSMTAKVQHSVDNSSWADLATFTAVTAANAYQRISGTGTVNRYLRAQYTITGTSPSFTFHLSAARL
jgi:hypothetical protein